MLTRADLPQEVWQAPCLGPTKLLEAQENVLISFNSFLKLTLRSKKMLGQGIIIVYITFILMLT
jgi:hypothetical protein